jgi:hypothetical protein
VFLPHDTSKAARIVEAAHAKHVPVISYDRLANAPVDLYVGFDLFSVGIEQAQSLVDRAPKGDYLLSGGSPLDANSKVVRAGQMKVLQPFIDRSDIHVLADVWVPEWGATEAYIMVTKELKGTDSTWHDGGRVGEDVYSERHINAKLTVVPVKGWTRSDWFDSTDLVWINLSPNMRNMNEAALYTGIGILEYTNVSVGRGTDTPFEVFGAPWIRPRVFAQYLNARQIPGVRFVPTWFTPAKDAKLGGQRVGGVQMIVTDRSVLDAPELGLELGSALLKVYPADWELDRLIDLLGMSRPWRSLSPAKIRGVLPRTISRICNNSCGPGKSI